MSKLLIIDDESMTRKGLRNHINWNRLGVHQVFDAGTAGEALEYITKEKPEIIISDVCMPGMNGIELGNHIRNIQPDCQIIFLSGYSDKEYLMGAIELSAVCYIEKPISIPEVEEAIEKAIARYENGQKQKESLHQVMKENLSLIEQRLIHNLVLPNKDLERCKKDMRRLGLNWENSSCFFVTMIAVREIRSAGLDLDEIATHMNQYFTAMQTIHIIKDASTILYISEMNSTEESPYLNLIGKLKAEIVSQKMFGIYCAIGQRVTRITDIYHSYQTSVILMQSLIFYGTKRIAYDQVFHEKGLELEKNILEKFEQSLKEQKIEQSKSIIKTFYQSLLAQSNVLPSTVKGVYYQFLSCVLMEASNIKLELMMKDSQVVHLIWEQLHGMDTLKQCQTFLENEVESYYQNAEELAVNNKTIYDVMSWISEHYANPDLCLNDIAGKVYLSPNYLSNLFRRKMDKTIGQYITDVRVEHAKELLKDRKLKLYDVAIQVGYSDANYFAKIFKKITGVTPSDYREKYNL